MSFYNPYQQGPAVGQGMQDMISQIIQVMMMKKMFGDEKKQPPPEIPQPEGTFKTLQKTENYIPTQAGQEGQSSFPPGLMQAIMQMLMSGQVNRQMPDQYYSGMQR